MFRKILLVIFVVGGLLALFNMVNTICYFTARSYLNEIKEGDFNSAFRHVKYDDYAGRHKPRISYEMAKDIWTSRMSELKTGGIYLHDYKDLQIDTDDYGYAEGKVTLLLSNHGVIEEHECSIVFHQGPDKWWQVEWLGLNGNHIFEKMSSCRLNFE